MLKKKIILISIALFAFPNLAGALTIPKSAGELAEMSGVSSQAYVVMDAKSGEILISKNPLVPWTAASLTKLVTALVVLDTKPKMSAAVAITQEDQNVGACGRGGACVRAKAGVKFTVDGLFHAALIPSANNAASALARSTGLSPLEFASRMNEKVKSLGAVGSYFVEPTGMNPNNTINAQDYAKIVSAAFLNPYLRKVAGLNEYTLRSPNNSRYNQTIKNTDKLLQDPDLQVLGAKTGYLEESKYNFSALLKFRNGTTLAVVVLGKERLSGAFAETKLLAQLAESAKVLAAFNQIAGVLGTSTIPTINKTY